MVFYSDDDDQSSSAFLISDTIFIAHILCHPESILIIHLAHNDKHILHTTFQLQLLQIEIGRILLSLINISIWVGNILRRILQERNRHIIRFPFPLGSQRQDAECHKHNQCKISLKSHNFSFLMQKYRIKT